MLTIEKKSLADQLYEILRQEIIDQTLKCGEKINIEDLKRKYNVSQTPIREALNRLQQDGLVENITNSGVKVIEIGKKDIVEIFKVYSALDCCAIKLAMENKNNIPHLLTELKYHLNLHTACLNENRIKDLKYHSVEFHRTFYRFAANDRLDRFFIQIKGQYDIIFAKYINFKENREHGLPEHRDIFSAVESLNCEAAVQLMEAHIFKSLHRLLKSID